nr:MAG TPA: hypothetical protein [Caudoviricetes sp.]
MHYIHILLVLLTLLVSLPNCRISFRKGYFFKASKATSRSGLPGIHFTALYHACQRYLSRRN